MLSLLLQVRAVSVYGVAGKWSEGISLGKMSTLNFISHMQFLVILK